VKIGIIGSGVSGLTAAHLLHREHEIVVFEADTRIGGHVHTVDVETSRGHVGIDTGFIVFNDRTYPNFVRLLSMLGVDWQTSSMGFSVRCERSGLEYGGDSLAALFAQRRNLVRPSFHRMLRDVLRFHREARAFLAKSEGDPTLGEFLAERRYSRELVDHYLVPMCAAVWSADPRSVLDIPSRTLLRFFERHGLLSVKDRPQWRVVRGGSARYVEALVRPFRDRIRTACPAVRVSRDERGAAVTLRGGDTLRFDRVILACHSDQALALLADPSDAEREILGAIAYQENEAILHTDASVLPRRRRAWSSWNYHLPEKDRGRATVTYCMNLLQGLDLPETFCVTLNRSDAIDPARIVRRIVYHHPVFTASAVAAQARHDAVDGVRNTHFCGAWWGHGFHEDGVRSALAVCDKLGARLR
jgi:predicted NAD/FAD-binding protein